MTPAVELRVAADRLHEIADDVMAYDALWDDMWNNRPCELPEVSGYVRGLSPRLVIAFGDLLTLAAERLEDRGFHPGRELLSVARMINGGES